MSAITPLAALDREQLIARLRQMMTAPGGSGASVLQTGWSAVDAALPRRGLEFGASHEWIGTAARGDDRRRVWNPPLGLLIHLVRQSQVGTPAQRALWIGGEVWPYPAALGLPLLSASVFVRACSVAERIMAANLALRSRTVCMVVVDGSGLDLTASRQLQLAAEAGASLCLIVKPPWQCSTLSAARTRWLVECAATAGQTQRWIVSLLRCKGLQPTASDALARWTLERDHATRAMRVVADVGDRSRATQTHQILQHAG